MIDIVPISALTDNYIWLIRHHTGACIAIDPGEAQPVLRYLQAQRLTLAAIFVTHHHSDHTAGIARLRQTYPVPVYGPHHPALPADIIPVHHQDYINIESLHLVYQAIEIPGHTLTHVAYYGENQLFCGDTLFSAGCGRLFEGTPEQMLNSLHQLANLPDATQVYCGHEYTKQNLAFALSLEPHHPKLLQYYEEVIALAKQHQPTLPSTIKKEKTINPFLRCHEAALKQAAEHAIGHPLTDELSVFTAIRRLKDKF